MRIGRWGRPFGLWDRQTAEFILCPLCGGEIYEGINGDYDEICADCAERMIEYGFEDD